MRVEPRGARQLAQDPYCYQSQISHFPTMNRLVGVDKNLKTSPRNPPRFVVAGIALSFSTLNYRELAATLRRIFGWQRRRNSKRCVQKLRKVQPQPAMPSAFAGVVHKAS